MIAATERILESERRLRPFDGHRYALGVVGFLGLSNVIVGVDGERDLVGTRLFRRPIELAIPVQHSCASRYPSMTAIGANVFTVYQPLDVKGARLLLAIVFNPGIEVYGVVRPDGGNVIFDARRLQIRPRNCGAATFVCAGAARMGVPLQRNVVQPSVITFPASDVSPSANGPERRSTISYPAGCRTQVSWINSMPASEYVPRIVNFPEGTSGLLSMA
jgi:hypothetical protein